MSPHSFSISSRKPLRKQPLFLRKITYLGLTLQNSRYKNPRAVDPASYMQEFQMGQGLPSTITLDYLLIKLIPTHVRDLHVDPSVPMDCQALCGARGRRGREASSVPRGCTYNERLLTSFQIKITCINRYHIRMKEISRLYSMRMYS